MCGRNRNPNAKVNGDAKKVPSGPPLSFAQWILSQHSRRKPEGVASAAHCRRGWAGFPLLKGCPRNEGLSQKTKHNCLTYSFTSPNGRAVTRSARRPDAD